MAVQLKPFGDRSGFKASVAMILPELKCHSPRKHSNETPEVGGAADDGLLHRADFAEVAG